MIHTRRLRIRPLQEADLPQVQQVWGDPEVMRFCGGAADGSRLLQTVRSCMRCQEEHGFSPFAVLRDEVLVGLCGFITLEDPEGIELIYHFLPAVWGQGYATEAVRAALAWAEQTLGHRYVEAAFDDRNSASRHVLDKAGFQYTEDRWFEDVQRQEPVYRFELRRQAPEAKP